MTNDIEQRLVGELSKISAWLQNLTIAVNNLTAALDKEGTLQHRMRRAGAIPAQSAAGEAELYVVKSWHSQNPNDVSTSVPMNRADAEQTERQARAGNPYIRTKIQNFTDQ